MKVCPICQHELKNDDVVVVLLLARYKRTADTTYDLSVMSQTISSHLFCVEGKQEMQAKTEVPPNAVH